MGSIVVSELEYAPPAAEPLFFDVSFTIKPGEHVALIGANGVGKSTILRILSGELEPDAGVFQLAGSMLRMTQDVGMSSPEQPLREMLIEVAPPALRDAGRSLFAAEAAMAAGDDDGTGYAEALTAWGDLSGYELEAAWAAAAARSVKTPVDDFATRTVAELSGGERKRLVLELLLTAAPDILLLDEPDNYLDVPTRTWLEQRIVDCPSTILMVSHDRTVLERVATKIVVIEGSGCWVHGGSYGTYPEAREARQKRLGDAVQRWNDEERRLYRHMKIMKQRAELNAGNAKKADAAETRWQRFVKVGPPPPPAPDQYISVNLRGADSARRVVALEAVSIDDLFFAFSDEVYFGERIGLIGPNGTGKTHLMRALNGELEPDDGVVKFGPRTSIGMFTQVHHRPDFEGQEIGDIIVDLVGNEEKARRTLGRYGLADHHRQRFDTLSGGQKARLEVLCLELAGHNVLLLDEPTDNLDIESSEALELALDGFVGTVIAVSHDRAFLSTMDRFVMINDDGDVLAIPDHDLAMRALADPDGVRSLPQVKSLVDDG